MAEHYILCVLSAIGTPKEEDGTPIPIDQAAVDKRTKRYTIIDAQDDEMSLDGFQTNEAPVKYLIDLSEADNNPITHIICLTSPRCSTEKVVIGESGEILTAKDWFERSIKLHYEIVHGYKGLENPACTDGYFRHLPYDGTDPSKNLQKLIEVLDEGPALIDIDTTGGPRDAAFLIATVVQFIESKYGYASPPEGSGGQPVGLGRTVYSNFDEAKLHLQNETFAINDLIHAIDAFTQYGKAHSLVDYFANRPMTATPISKEMIDLCNAMSAFADDLSLCRTGNINDRINDIYAALDKFEEQTKRKIDAYESSQDPYYRVQRGEILFLTLVDNLRQGMPHQVRLDGGRRDQALQTLDIIKWCVKRGMLQQALALFKERVPEVLEQLDMIEWVDDLPHYDGRNRQIEEMVSRLSQLSKGSKRFANARSEYVLDWETIEGLSKHLTSNRYKNRRNYELAPFKWWEIKAALCAARPKDVTDGLHLIVKDEEHLRAALVWYRIMGDIRNDVMHVHENESQGLSKYLEVCKAFFRDDGAIDCQYDGTPDSLKDSFALALNAAAGNVTLKCANRIDQFSSDWLAKR